MADPKSFFLGGAIHEYLVAHGTPPDPVQSGLIERTAALGAVSGMQISPEQGAFMTLVTRLVGARSAVEVGTFTGYSALCIARGLADGGRLLCCDVSEEWTAVAREAWTDAGVADRIDLRIAPAVDTLGALPDERTIDLAFVDADKPNYRNYVDALLPGCVRTRCSWWTTSCGAARWSTTPSPTRTPRRSGRSTTGSPPTRASRP